MATMQMQLNSMPHPSLPLKQGGAVAPRGNAAAGKAEARRSFGSQSSSSSSLPTAASLRTQLQIRKSFGGGSSNIGRATVRTSCNSRGSQSSVIDAEPPIAAAAAAETSSRPLAFLTATAMDELSGWPQKVKGVHHGGAPASSKDVVFGREFVENTCDSSTDAAAAHVDDDDEDGSVERTSDGLLLGSEAAGVHDASLHWYGDEADEERSRALKYTQVSRRQRSLPSRPPEKVSWRLFVEGVRSPPLELSDRRSRTSSSQELQEKIMFLESLGIDSSALLAQYPALSTCPAENVRAVARFLEDGCQLRRRAVVRVLTRHPQLLGHSVDGSFRPALAFLRDEVGLREQDVPTVVHRCSRLLTAGVDARLRPALRFLQSLGFTHLPLVVSHNATLLASGVDTKLAPKLAFLQSLGLSRADAAHALIRFPALFNYSVADNLRPKFAYLVDDMGRGLDDLRAFPQYFGYSLESRIRPRHELLRRRNLALSLPNLLRPSDAEFHTRFKHESAELKHNHQPPPSVRPVSRSCV